MTPIEAVEYMETTFNPVRPERWGIMYRLYREKVVCYIPETSCADHIYQVYDKNEFIEMWLKSHYTETRKVELLPFYEKNNSIL